MSRRMWASNVHFWTKRCGVRPNVTAETGTRFARQTFSLMDRIFLAVIVLSLLLIATSSGLLIFANSGAMTMSAASVPASADMRDARLMPRRTAYDKLTPPDGGPSERF